MYAEARKWQVTCSSAARCMHKSQAPGGCRSVVGLLAGACPAARQRE